VRNRARDSQHCRNALVNAELSRRLWLALACTVVSAAVGLVAQPAVAHGCGSPSNGQQAGLFDVRQQETLLLENLDSTLADVESRYILAARVDYEAFSEIWDDVNGAVAGDNSDVCVNIGNEIARLDDVLVGRPVADVDVDASAEALGRLQTTLLTLVAPVPSSGGDSPELPPDEH
jgi:hypothetical protein